MCFSWSSAELNLHVKYGALLLPAKASLVSDYMYVYIKENKIQA